MPIGGERAGVQNPLIRYAEEAGKPTPNPSLEGGAQDREQDWAHDLALNWFPPL
jgi:hypothetical protein